MCNCVKSKEENPCSNCSNYGKINPIALFKMQKSQYDPSTCGIMTQYYLHGIAFELAKKIEHSLVILQKIPERCKCNIFDEIKETCELNGKNIEKCPHEFCSKLTAREKYVRIEATDLYFNGFSHTCRDIRIKDDPGENDKDIQLERKDEYKTFYNICRCHNLDGLAAEYLSENKENAKEELERLSGKPIFEGKTNNDNLYITYTCPYSKFMECALKFEYHGLSAVIIFGQFKDKSDDELMQQIDNIFQEIEKMKTHFENVYKNRLNNIVSQQNESVTQKLAEEWQKQQLEITQSQNEIINQYNKFKEKVHECVDKFADIAGIEHYSCYMTEHLDVQYGTHLTNKHGAKIEDDIFTSRHQLTRSGFATLDKAGKDFILLKEDLKQRGLQEEDEHVHLLFLPAKQLFNMFIYFVRSKSIDDKDELIEEAYRNFFTNTASTIKSIASNYFYMYQKSTIERFTKNMRHELGQSNAGFLANIQVFENYPWQSESHEAEKKADNIVKNARSYAYSTLLKTNSSRYIDGVPEPSKKWFYPYGKFLYKWSEVYYDSMASNDLRLRIPSKDSIDYNSQPRMYADPDMIEQVAYNLTNNAMKYSIPGTTVIVNCRLNYRNDMYELIVTNYAIPLANADEYERIFDYGFQGRHAKEIRDDNTVNTESSGIGLALSREIAVKHGGTLEFEYERICDVCVPFFRLYERNFYSPIVQELLLKNEIPDLREALSKEMQRLEKENLSALREITAINLLRDAHYDYSSSEIIDKIDMPVEKYTFTLSIPHKTGGSHE